MGKTYNGRTIDEDIENFENDLHDALCMAMGAMTKPVYELLQHFMEERVYSYEPKYDHRRYDGTITDEKTGEVFEMFDSLYWHISSTNFDYLPLYTYNNTWVLDAPWQGKSDGLPSLADAVESGIAMHGAGARPFVDEADYWLEYSGNQYLAEAINSSGIFDDAIE